MFNNNWGGGARTPVKITHLKRIETKRQRCIRQAGASYLIHESL